MYPYIRIFDKVIGTYGLCMVLGIFLAGFLAVKRGKRHGLAMEDILIVSATAIGFAIFGGGLLYVLVTFPMDVVIDRILAGDFAFLTGGIVFYGGLIGGIAGAFLGAHIAKRRMQDLIVTIVPFVPLGHAIGRIGCLMAGCCHGMEYSGHLAVYYPRSVLSLPPEQGYFPVQPLEALINVVICGILLFVEKRKKLGSELLFVYLGLYAVSRFTLEFFRGDAARGIYFTLSVSQWISIGLLAISMLAFGIFRWKNKKETHSNTGEI